MIKNKKNINKTEENKDMDKSSIKNNEEEIIDDQEKSNEVMGDDLVRLKKLEEDMEKKVKEIESLTDTMKRRQADFENYKKRMIKIQDDEKKLAIKDFALDIINIYDDLLRAYDSVCNISREKPAEEICDTFSHGFSMISKRIEEVLKNHKIEEIDSLNTPFNPNFNEAVEIDENDTVTQDLITKVHQKGFKLDDYVIRTAKVKVTKPKKISAENSGNTADSSDANKGNVQ